MDRLPNDIWSDQGLDRKYRFEQHLASSAMAVVVMARHLDLDERVAIKFLSPEALRSRAAVVRFRREARAAAKIKSQHVVRIIDVATTATDIPYIVMEYLDGKDLQRLLAQYPQHQAPISEAVDYILQASEAVNEGHSLGVVHRDLKPANLFCVDRGDGYPLIKVLDFGISKFVASIGEVERTDRHEILGSPRYMSPEQIDSAHNVDHRTDIWSLGVILYEAIAGRPPFDGDLVPEVWGRIRHASPDPLPALRRDCPTELWEVVAKCLKKDPAQRYADLGELARSLAPMAPERSRGSIARIRWTVESPGQTATTPSIFANAYARDSSQPHRRMSHRWLLPGSVAATLGIGLTVVVIGMGTLVGAPRPPASSSHAHQIQTSTGAHPTVGDSKSDVPDAWVVVPVPAASNVDRQQRHAVSPAERPRKKPLGSRPTAATAAPSTSGSLTAPAEHASASAARAAPIPPVYSSEPVWMVEPITKRK